MSKEKNVVGYDNNEQYDIELGPTAQESGFKTGYEYTTGNQTSKKHIKKEE